MSRPTLDQYMIAIAVTVATRSTCLRRHVGCVLVDGAGRILATGYNGVARGVPHCNEGTTVKCFTHEFAVKEVARLAAFGERAHVVGGSNEYVYYPRACEGAGLPSGEGHDLCQAIHAEANALVWCREPDKIATAYVTTAPCVPCVKLLLGTSCGLIVFLHDHPMAAQAQALWIQAGRKWLKI